ncbi:MAG: TAXI family TRAP transporter solute-binding subunit, partial [Acidaminococcaceae bacterium]|nr:TAXI family TRAP transporter solute-binding subunit [Acidaminococcaceae bacterium]
MKKIFASIACLAAATFISLGLTTPTEAATKFINIGTGGTAGTYYPLGGAMADIFNKNVPNCNASAQSTGASVANVNLLAQGNVDIALLQNDIASYALNGVAMFKGRQSDALRG